jgi:hypothetical protein
VLSSFNFLYVLCYCRFFKSFNVLSFLPIIFPLLFTNIRGFFYAKIPYTYTHTLKKFQQDSKIVVVFPISRCGSLTVNCPVHSHNYTVRLPSQHPPRNLRDTICTRISDFLDLSGTTIAFASVSSSREVEHPLSLFSIYSLPL